MYQLVYVSSAPRPLSPQDLNEILDVSRRNNRKLGITGLLLHLDQGFLQVLEGPKDAVLEVFERVEHDSRHHGVRVLVQRDTDERLFADWSMGFDRPSRRDLNSAGVFEITQAAIDGAILPEKAADIAVLLRNFYRINAGNCAA